jgi:hypothetical protein
MKTCIIWKGAKQSKGYGCTRLDGEYILVHRLAYKLAHPRENIDRKLILHRCDVRLCFNEKHLFSGTAQNNTDDMMKKGRWVKPSYHHGTEHHNAKLSRTAVAEIRRRHRPGKKWGAQVLAKKYGVKRQTISNVVAGRTKY